MQPPNVFIGLFFKTKPFQQPAKDAGAVCECPSRRLTATAAGRRLQSQGEELHPITTPEWAQIQAGVSAVRKSPLYPQNTHAKVAP